MIQPLTIQPKEAAYQLSALQVALKSRGYRLPILVEGSHQWCLQFVSQVLLHIAVSHQDNTIWYSKFAPKDTWQLLDSRINHELGREADFLIYDMYSGMNADALAALSGTLRGGGLLFLLCPALDQWPGFVDPVATKIAVEPGGVGAVKRNFISRMAWYAEHCSHKVRLCESGLADFPTITKSTGSVNYQDQLGCVNEGQRKIVEAVLHVVSGHRNRPLVIQADRGRGKSSAIGIAATQLLNQGKRIIVTAPRPEAIESILKMCQTSAGRPEFFAPDYLLQVLPAADLVIVDEAAAIAPDMLKRILEHYSRVVMATTVNGYEGTGRGFSIRFTGHLQKHFPGWHQMTLDQPIRWGNGDWLESFLNDVLLLKPTTPNIKSDLLCTACHLTEFKYRAGGQDEVELNAIFELLISAHYRTRPSDLRTLLDGGNVRLFTLKHGSCIAAVVMLAEEGHIPDDLASQIMEGKRRPHGQVLPQTLAVHCAQSVALKLRHWRIIRIAVQPQLQANGIGSDLINKIADLARRESIDCVGSVFSASAQLIKFWQLNQCSVLRVGYTREATTGAYTVVVGQGLSVAGKELVTAAQCGFMQDFPLSLFGVHQELPFDFVLQVACSLPYIGEDVTQDQHGLEQYLSGYAVYENVAVTLWRSLWSRYRSVQHWASLSDQQKQLIVIKVMQNHSWKHCIAILKFSGQKQARQQLRQALMQMSSLKQITGPTS